jgi:serine/threonine-protein kinase RsbW
MTDRFIARNGCDSANSRGWRDFQTIQIGHMPQGSMVIDFEKPSCYLGSMSLKPRSFHLTIASRLEEMETVHQLVQEAVKEYKLSDDLAHWIELTISESMINAIQHGNKADPAKKATLRISSTGETIEIIVEDQGGGFKLDKVADPTDSANLLKPSGRGILIIRSFMDEVDLTIREGGGSSLRMVKRIQGNTQ